uniref:Uncharacterized protein n=2 Tax=Panagrolaimus sp. JU765 TaxID=591449 RepID=A0AC34RD97_9BILA
MSKNEIVLPCLSEFPDISLSSLTNFEFSDSDIENPEILKSVAENYASTSISDPKKDEFICEDDFGQPVTPTTEVEIDWSQFGINLKHFSTPMRIGVDERRKHYPPELKHRDPYILYRRFRRALHEATETNYYKKLDNPYAFEMFVEFRHSEKLMFERLSKRVAEESERIEIREMLTIERIKERFEMEKEKILKAKELAVKELAQKMLTENDDERKQLEAELNVMGEDGEVPLNFMYVPNRKQLRRRTGHNDPSNDHPEKIDNYVPIYQVHWIDHKDIAGDLEIFDSVLKSHEKPAEDRHYSVSVHEGRLILDGKAFNRSHNQIIYIKSRSFGRFPAIILSLSESSGCLTVRSTIKGDPRHITITFNDLENGRVKLAKKPFVS